MQSKMEDTNQVFFVSQDAPVSIRAAAVTKSFSHPSTWFENNANQKPKLYVKNRVGNSITLGVIRSSVFCGIQGANVDLQEAILYLTLLGQTMLEENETEWSSYGLTIAAAGSQVSPISLLSIEYQTDEMPLIKTRLEIDETCDGRILLYLLSVYRLTRATVDEHRRRVDSGLTKLAQRHPLPGDDNQMLANPGGPTTGANWQNNPNYCKLIAAYDMFFHRYPNHPYAYARFGTLGSRHRDCASLTILLNTYRLLGMTKPSQLIRWLFTEELEKEILIMFKEKEEYDLDASYFPYQVDFGLVTKSAYSSMVCPAIYFLCSVIHALSAEERGLRARFTLDSNIANVYANSKLISYVYSSSTAGSKEERDNVRLGLKGDEPLPGNENLGMRVYRPMTTVPVDWLTYFLLNPECSEKIEAFVQSRAAKITSPRAGTIGEYIKSSIHNT